MPQAELGFGFSLAFPLPSIPTPTIPSTQPKSRQHTEMIRVKKLHPSRVCALPSNPLLFNFVSQGRLGEYTAIQYPFNSRG